MSWKDKQIGGEHYMNMKFQPMEFILANSLGWAEGEILKYVCRWQHKGGVQDLLKAKHIIDALIEEHHTDNHTDDPFNCRGPDGGK